MPSSPGLLTKTGTVVLATGALAAAISQELYVVNEETVVAIGSLIMFTVIAKACWFVIVLLPYQLEFFSQALSAPYKEWAETNIQVRCIPMIYLTYCLLNLVYS